jgi:threonine/homoserine/homoserine lactone efflux protein
VKFVGAAYLTYLGVRTLRDSFRAAADQAVAAARTRSVRAPFVQGWLSNVLNPKVARFYLTFLPQFISPGDSVLAKSLLLAAIHAVLGLVWLPLYAYAIDRIGAVVRGARRWLERVSGGALIGLGVRLAVDRR